MFPVLAMIDLIKTERILYAYNNRYLLTVSQSDFSFIECLQGNKMIMIKLSKMIRKNFCTYYLLLFKTFHFD